MDHVANNYLDQSAVAARKITKALLDLDAKSSNSATLPEEMVSESYICTKPSDRTGYRALLSYLVTSYSDGLRKRCVPQTDPNHRKDHQHRRSPERRPPHRWHGHRGANCTDWAGPSFAEAFANLESYVARTCKYTLQLGSSISYNTILPPSMSKSFAGAMALCSAFKVSNTNIPTQSQVQAKLSLYAIRHRGVPAHCIPDGRMGSHGRNRAEALQQARHESVYGSHGESRVGRQYDVARRG